VPRVLRNDSRYNTDEFDRAADAAAEEIAAKETANAEQEHRDG